MIIKSFINNYIPLNNYTNQAQKSPAFGTNNRSYITPSGKKIGCNSWLFRNDVDWRRLAKYELKHFKDKPKVNIVMYACSDASEGYTKIMSLFEAVKYDEKDKVQKFFPITAFDIDKEIVEAAKSGLVNTCMVDRMELQMNTENYEDYFVHTIETLDIKNDIDLQSKQTMKAKRILTDNIRFEHGDMFQKIKTLEDDSNTILMCRNILGYFEDERIESFISSASQKLKSGSLFVVGDHDKLISNLSDCMKKYGFKEVMKNVYEKA